MPTAGVGVDLVSIPRMERALERTPRLKERLFTAEERAYCDSRAHPAEHYAARFAAREAVLKALGTGFRGVGLSGVSVALDDAGRPSAVLAGRAREAAERQGVVEVEISLSHTHEVAVANAVAVTESARPPKEERPSAEQELRASFKEAREILLDLERVEPDPDPARSSCRSEHAEDLDRSSCRSERSGRDGGVSE
ncbi:holo-ACP synthase [Olsenella sp. YH-ols2217]|uniref:Holo-[acyl-carrier-protein] synthase n=1 Tax=Kribbibacterium absianum TaxID=3044210 RepID=A0ABT6ZLD2_9ACTN|nr:MULTISPECIES: holo-ACP synthase [unclassified Olsenella]MDJ1122564.1 holo-ACP synthase [Olsenella sp. YH-ols2216]MDJ1129476.1 holo-ACP synthase [Olsenella sp. YH-ols2217]